jgi:ABC-type nickel/cobalt efflux system permease component RcnA
VFGLDELVTSHAEGRGVAVAVALAFVLGLRHATDPDHLVAVSTLVAAAQERHARVAVRLGAAWGAGHGVTLLGLGLPAVLFHDLLPATLERAAEILIGAIILVLGLRVLRAWRRGAFHAHAHDHGQHRHVHVHAHRDDHAHMHSHPLRTARQAFAVGTVHGVAGTAGVTVLLLAAIPDQETAALALVCLALGSAVSMALISSALGAFLGSAGGRVASARGVPVLGAAAAAFGVWYMGAAVLGG